MSNGDGGESGGGRSLDDGRGGDWGSVVEVSSEERVRNDLESVLSGVLGGG